ncbi:MAG: glycerol-3-phosphate responsive antiterminator [Clostridia bacterium]|nr:glycerol-3-phosphate responsive antiterminator [Clostridia bacterium]
MSDEKKKVIYAVKGNEELERALQRDGKIIFLLKADINSAAETVERCHAAGKQVYIHLDLAVGMGKDEAAIRFLAEHIRPDGVLSTKINVVKTAKDYGLRTIYRVFMIDSQSMDSAIANIRKYSPDAIEIMPGVAYDAITEIKECVSADIIAGGLIKTVEHAEKAIKSGAVAVSTSCEELW